MGLLLLGVLFHTFILNGLADFLIVQDKLEKADAIVVLSGDSNGERVKQAAILYKQGYGRFLVMSGGLITWDQTYAANMKRQAMYLGIPAAAILLEDRSKSTYENAKFSLPILKNKGIHSIIVVSSPFHMRRAKGVFQTLCRSEGIKVKAYPVQNSAYQPHEWWTRHEDTQNTIIEYLSLFFYILKGYLRAIIIP